MTDALTARSWIATLDRIVHHTDDETLRTLALMLSGIIVTSDDPHVADIIDAYGLRLLGEAA